MLELKNVSKFYYNKNTVASGFSKINLKLNLGEFIAITGESGSGKSTLLNVLSGLDTYEEGEMYVEGQETSGYTETDFENYRKKYIGKIFQNFNLVNSYTVYQNIELVLLINGLKRKDVKQKVLDTIKKVGLTKYKNTKVSKLSGGQKQRVAIARALIKDTPIIVADEPTGNLDSEAAVNIMKLLGEVAENKLVIIVTHNYELVEPYATRKITMHDGKIIEDKILKDAKKVKKAPETIEYKNISNINKLRLGFRNTFNIFSKFILLLAVYILLNMAVLGGYSALKKMEYEEGKNGYNSYFNFSDDTRVVIKKKDLSEITEEDYSKIEKLSNVNYIAKNDLFLDKYISLSSDNYGISGKLADFSTLKQEITLGRMPETKNEIVISVPKNNMAYISDNVLNKEFNLSYDGMESLLEGSVKIVGIAEFESKNYYTFNIYLKEEQLNEVRKKMSIGDSSVEAILNGHVLNCSNYGMQYRIIPSKLVAKGKAFVPEELNYICKNYNCRNYLMEIKVDNKYFSSELDVKISKTITKKNIKSLLKIDNYERYSKAIFINEEEYYNLYNKGNYQSSVFVKDIKEMETTVTELENLDYTVLPIKDTLISYSGLSGVIEKAFTIISTVVVIVALFFISYFIIKIILKSRNVYYSTIRILGATRRNAKEILKIELFTILNISFGLILAFIYLIKNSYIKLQFILELINYIELKDYIILYIILLVISLLISKRYAKQLFRKSAMNTYREEV